jgi:hypothetical protein
MTREDFVTELLAAAQCGTLLTTKHNPATLPAPRDKWRSVTCMSPSDLEDFLRSGEYTIRSYHNHDARHPPHYFEIVPSKTSIVAGSGVPAHSTTPTTACDRFVAVSGAEQGWHLFAESSARIQAKQSRGDLTFQVEFL